MTTRRALIALAVPFLFLLAIAVSNPQDGFAAPAANTSGSLGIIGKDGKLAGECPLKHTAVRGAISGFLARVTVTQQFQNTSDRAIEAVYVFPLPDNSAVDDMTIQVGERTIKGVIKRREEARKIYEDARRQGQVAALLDQERPNVFTQSVANIMPGAEISVTISYVQTLAYEAGSYQFVFPMVVGPRYVPGNMTGNIAHGREPDTDQVPDGSRITPPITPKGTRAGHDISLELAIDASVPIYKVRSKSHKIDVQQMSATTAEVKLRNGAEIPNKDFILKYDVAGTQISDGVLFHADARGPGGFFSLILQPPERFPEYDVTPKELVFVLDTSGSMMGFPIEKAKQVIDRALDGLYPGDTFNLITFSGDTAILFPKPVYPTSENLQRAKEFLASRQGGGGTEMMKAIRAALDPSDAQDHVRVVCFLTDGEVGNDMAIIGEVQKHPNARVFSFGIGQSVNRFLLSRMAEAGRGAVEFVTLADKAEAAANRFYERIRAPLLTDVAVDFGKLPVAEVYPRRLPDLFSGHPLIISGRYTVPAQGTVTLRGTRAGVPFVRRIPVNFSANAPNHDVLASIWARTKIEDLMSQDWAGVQQGKPAGDLREQIAQLGLDYRLMTQYTSFVAVEDRIVNTGGKPTRVQVPVEMPEGVAYEGIFGAERKDQYQFAARTAKMAMAPMSVPAMPSQAVVVNGAVGGGGGGVGSGNGPGVGPGKGGGIGGGVYRVGGGVSAPRAVYAPDAEYSNEAREAKVEGSVLLWLIVGPNGRPRDIRVARSLNAGLDQKAIEALRKWKFQPAMKDGQPIAAQISVEVIFSGGKSTATLRPGAVSLEGSAPAAKRDPQRQLLESKFHPDVVAAFDNCVHRNARCKLPPGDKLVLQLFLTDSSPATLQRLRTLGFQVTANPRPKLVVGTVTFDSLPTLAALPQVQFGALRR